ncbi:RDD family protein [Dactylosporangium sp. NPDC051485]|uniref:RDD family protein n=1 Tax=Dactylosporangium sp. NPDC051485 TaxID=3154846 RepID=UPI0034246556
MTYPSSSADVHVTGRRVVATIVDAVLLGCLGGIVAQVAGVETTASGFSSTRLSSGGSVLWFVLVVLYYVLLEGLFGRTVGKLVTGIRVVDEVTGAAPGIGKAIIRTLLRIIDGLFAYLVGFIVVLCSQRRRRLGDMAARTLVVRA